MFADLNPDISRVLNRRSVEFGIPTRDSVQNAWPYFAAFVPYPFRQGVSVGADGFQRPDQVEAIGPDGFLIPAGGMADFHVPLPRNAAFQLEWIRYTAHFRRPSACICQPSVSGTAEDPNGFTGDLLADMAAFTLETVDGSDLPCNTEFTFVQTYNEGEDNYLTEVYIGETLVAGSDPWTWDGSPVTLTAIGDSNIQGTWTPRDGTPSEESLNGSLLACPPDTYSANAYGSRYYLTGSQDLFATPGTSSIYTAQGHQLRPWAEYLDVTVFLGSAGSRDYYGAEGLTANQGTEEIPIPVQGLQSADDGGGAMPLRALLAGNTTLSIRARNRAPVDLRLDGVAFGYQVQK